MADSSEAIIEQTSHFSSKDESGQDIEFEATLRFLISPTGEVTLSVPGATETSRAVTVVGPQTSLSGGSQTSISGGPQTSTSRGPQTSGSQASGPQTSTSRSQGISVSDGRSTSPSGGSGKVVGQIDIGVEAPGLGGHTDGDIYVERGQSRRVLTDEAIDRAFPRGPEPSPDCTFKQFIPSEPCKERVCNRSG